MCAAARIDEGTVPSGRGGVASTTSGTPATRAGITVMSTVDGYAARPSNPRPSSRSASSPSASTREQISATASRSVANRVRSSLRRDRGESSHEPTSNLLTGIARSLAHPGDHRLDSRRARLEARLVGDQPGARGAEYRRDAQPVVSQRPSRRRQVDDAVDQADLRRQLYRSV